jgi:broad specificity phosphatase PhoE
MKINFIFLRHGESCQQITRLIDDPKKRKEMFHKFFDPTLTDNGIENSVTTGIQVKNVLNKNFNINTFDIIGCSPMLRAIETAHYMTKNYNYTNPIFVLPFLRECHGCVQPVKEKDTPKKLDEIWPMKSIETQKEYLKSQNIDNISFYYTRNLLARSQPGNIENFIKWLQTNFKLPNKPVVNILIVLHSHVIMDAFDKNGVYNNSGFLMTATKNESEIIYNKKNIVAVWPTILQKSLKCPSIKCPNICNYTSSLEEDINKLKI